MSEFGLRITSAEDQRKVLERQRRISLPYPDGSSTILQNGYVGSFLDLDGNLKSENELILKYREMANQVELDRAIQDIVNEAIVFNEEGECVSINLDSAEGISESIKKKVTDEFRNVLRILDFKNGAYDLFRSWYVDGRIYLQTVTDKESLNKGIMSVEWIDPIKIKKIRRISKRREAGIDIIDGIEEHFVYNEMGVDNSLAPVMSTRIAPDEIVYVPSGVMNAKRTQVLSHLNKAIKPFNQLQMLEIAMVIYRLARAPERRLFYIDVGTMSAQKASQYVQQIQQQFRNKLVYDAETGEVRDDRKFMTVLEDFWLPRREGGRGTEISTLPGAMNLDQIEDVNYIRQKLYNALNIPISRLQPETGFSLGRSTEITRDEIAFSKFIKRVRKQFAQIFDQLLARQLRLKNIMTSEEWEKIKQDIWYDFNEDNNFEELKEAELNRERIDMVNNSRDLIGKMVSRKWVQKNMLRFTDEEIKEMNKEIEEEGKEDLQRMKQGLPPKSFDQMQQPFFDQQQQQGGFGGDEQQQPQEQPQKDKPKESEQ